MDKTQLRTMYKQRLAAQSAADRAAASNAIIARLLASAEYARARTLFCYVATDREVETHGLLEQAWRDGKRVAVPRVAEDRIAAVARLNRLDELRPGSFGILEPPASAESVDVTDLDLIIIPGLAFTLDGARLGHGRGHFDRWLANVPAATPTMGLAFDFQIAGTLPQEPHDIKIRKILVPASRNKFDN